MGNAAKAIVTRVTVEEAGQGSFAKIDVKWLEELGDNKRGKNWR
jgi:hypothetical protein